MIHRYTWHFSLQIIDITMLYLSEQSTRLYSEIRKCVCYPQVLTKKDHSEFTCFAAWTHTDMCEEEVINYSPYMYTEIWQNNKQNLHTSTKEQNKILHFITLWNHISYSTEI